MKKVLILVACLWFGVNAQAQSNGINPRTAVEAQANLDVQSYLQLIPQGQEQEYGFDNRADFSKVSIGESYAMYFAERKEGKINLLPTRTYRVPVKVNGKSVALLTVKYNENGTAEIVDFGANKLAQKLDAFESNYKSSNDRILVRNTYVKQDFIVADLAALSSKDANGVISINTQSAAKLYPIAAGKQASMGSSSFVNATLTAVVK